MNEVQLRVIEFPDMVKKEQTNKLDIATDRDFQFVADEAFKVNQAILKEGNFKQVPFSTYEKIIRGLTYKGKQLKFSKASSIFGFFTYLIIKMQDNRSKAHDKQNSKMLDMYECSVYKSKKDICNEVGIDGRTFDDYMEILIENGFVCRMIGTGHSFQPKYYWFIFLEPNPTFCKKFSNKKITNSKNKDCENLTRK